MSDEMYDKGLEIRRAVLGAEYVDKSVANADDFNRDFQELVTSYCWGWCWGREGLSKRDRSLLNLGMLSALGKLEELKLHVRGALTNGVTVDEIKEVLLQVAIYAGVPASLSAFKAAREVLEAEGALK
jgi:4-carboxymuconolactone decarboxylase